MSRKEEKLQEGRNVTERKEPSRIPGEEERKENTKENLCK